MNLPAHREVGLLKKAHGRKGALRLQLDEAFKGLAEQVDHFFLEIEGQFIPFFIQTVHAGPPLTIQFDSIDTPEKAKKIAGAALYIREGQAGFAVDRPMDQKELLKGFLAIDEKGADIGRIEEVRELPQQMMAVVLIDGKERYIPLHPDLIVGIDEEEEIIQFDLPEGMLEL